MLAGGEKKMNRTTAVLIRELVDPGPGVKKNLDQGGLRVHAGPGKRRNPIEKSGGGFQKKSGAKQVGIPGENALMKIREGR